MKTRLAIVDDEPRMGQILAMVLRRDGHEVSVFEGGSAFLEAQEGGFDLLLTDLKMPGMDGVALLSEARARDPELPVILITAHATLATAVEAMKRGAVDYLEKPVDNEVCRAAVRRALTQTRLARENRYLRAQLQSRHGLESIVAESAGMRGALDLARRAARSRSTVLVTGESGTGKELVARAIHLHSDRVGGPFVAVNCKAFAAGVLESELFGHARGAFTGADRGRPGVFERASGGTLFLDEIGEVDLDFQAKLLRVLQDGEVLPVGGARPLAVDARVVAATNRDLAGEVRAGRFREDLYFRLAVIPVHLPPLRERPEDVLPLARLFLARHAAELGRALTGWSPEVERWLTTHRWPGNVRELANTLERGVVLARGDRVELGDLLVGPRPPGASAGGTLQEVLDARAAQYIREVLAASGGVRVEAAARLGVERTTLYRLMRKYGID